MSADTRTVSAVPLLAGTLLFTGAFAILCEDALHHPNINHLLQPLLMLGTITAGNMAHHRLMSWRIPSGLAFALLALMGSASVVYATLSRTATARDLQAAEALASGRQLSELQDALDAAKRGAAIECKVIGDRCKAWQARVDQLTKQMAPLRSVSVDPRADALARLAELLSLDGKRTRAIVGALDPVILPLFLEVGCILFFAAAFPHRRKLPPIAGKSEERIVEVSRSWSQADALADLKRLKQVGGQKLLAERWGVSEGCVSKWMAAWASQGEVVRSRDGRKKPARALLGRA